MKDTLRENPGANASVLLDKLEPETVKINEDEVNQDGRNKESNAVQS